MIKQNTANRIILNADSIALFRKSGDRIKLTNTGVSRKLTGFHSLLPYLDERHATELINDTTFESAQRRL